MTALDDDDLRRLGELFAHRPDRMLALAAPWRQQGRTIESRVGGTSMGRTLPDGAPVRITLTLATDWRRGDLIAFLLGARVTVHRVLARTGSRRRPLLITGGDARALPDPPLAVAQVLGRVTGVCIGGVWRAPDPAPRAPLLVRGVRTAATGLLALAGCAGGRVATACAHALYRLARVAAPGSGGTAAITPAATTRASGPTARPPAD